MNRSDYVKFILKDISDETIIISSTGLISRELFLQEDRPLNFYMQGSMGNALAIGIGIALQIKRQVIVINGDASVLMSLGSLITAERLRKENKLNNLIHYVLDNNSHESTGGQKSNSNLINFSHLFKNTVVYKMKPDFSIPPRITLSPKQITQRFQNALFRKQEQ